MRDAAGSEERTRPRMRAINELIDQHEGAGRQFFLERTTGGERNEIGHACALKHVDIGAIVARREPMALTLPREKDNRQTISPVSSAPDGLLQGLSMILLCALVSPGKS